MLKTFFEVAPQCSHPAARGESFARRASTRGTTGFHVRSKARFIARRSRLPIRARRAISFAAAFGTRPTSASTSARAASTSSQRWSVALSSQIARMAGVPKRSLK